MTGLFELRSEVVVVNMVDELVKLFEDNGRLRLAECGKSNMPEVRRFCDEFNGDIVVQHAIFCVLLFRYVFFFYTTKKNMYSE